MKRIYFEFFHISKHGKVSEKVMLTRIAVSIVTIIACMAAMSFAAYAYFSYGLYSSESTITAATYELNVTDITDAQNIISVNDVYEITKSTDFQISVTDDTNASVGYCKITVITDLKNADDTPVVQNFYTEPIWREDDAQNGKLNTRTIKIEIPDGKRASVFFTAEWGSYSGEAIQNGTITADSISYASAVSGNAETQSETEVTE